MKNCFASPTLKVHNRKYPKRKILIFKKSFRELCSSRVRSTVAIILLVIAGICVRPSFPRCHFRAPHFIQFNTQKIKSGRGRRRFGVKVTSAINTKCVPHYQTHLFAELEYQRRWEGGVSRVSSKAHVLRWTLTHLSHCRSRDEDKKNGRVARRRSKKEGRGATGQSHKIQKCWPR